MSTSVGEGTILFLSESAKLWRISREMRKMLNVKMKPCCIGLFVLSLMPLLALSAASGTILKRPSMVSPKVDNQAGAVGQAGQEEYRHALRAFNNGHLRRAYNHLLHAIEWEPDNLEYHLRAVEFAQQIARTDWAAEHFTDALSLKAQDPTLLSAWVFWGKNFSSSKYSQRRQQRSSLHQGLFTQRRSETEDMAELRKKFRKHPNQIQVLSALLDASLRQEHASELAMMLKEMWQRSELKNQSALGLIPGLMLHAGHERMAQQVLLKIEREHNFSGHWQIKQAALLLARHKSRQAQWLLEQLVAPVRSEKFMRWNDVVLRHQARLLLAFMAVGKNQVDILHDLATMVQQDIVLVKHAQPHSGADVLGPPAETLLLSELNCYQALIVSRDNIRQSFRLIERAKLLDPQQRMLDYFHLWLAIKAQQWPIAMQLMGFLQSRSVFSRMHGIDYLWQVSPQFTLLRATVLVKQQRFSEAKSLLTAIEMHALSHPDIKGLMSQLEQIELRRHLQHISALSPQHSLSDDHARIAFTIERANVLSEAGEAHLGLALVDTLRQEYPQHSLLSKVHLKFLILSGYFDAAQDLLDQLMADLEMDEFVAAQVQILKGQTKYAQAAYWLYPLIGDPKVAGQWAVLMAQAGDAAMVNSQAQHVIIPVAGLLAAAAIVQDVDDALLIYQLYRLALRAKPTDPMLLNNVAWHGRHLEHVDPADLLHMAQRAVRAMPYNAAIVDTYCALLNQQQRFDETIAYLHEQVHSAMLQTHAGLLSRLATAYRGIAQTKAARVTFNAMYALRSRRDWPHEVTREDIRHIIQSMSLASIHEAVVVAKGE